METTIRYDGARPTKAAFIMEFRDGEVVCETDYFGELFDPPGYRSSWVELMRDDETLDEAASGTFHAADARLFMVHDTGAEIL
jgi:hypothetical protein